MTVTPQPQRRFSSPTWWAGAAERALKTAAQAALAAVGAAATLQAVPWQTVASTAALAAVLSLLTSVADPDRADTAIATGATR